MIARSRLVFAGIMVLSSALHLGAVTLLWIEPAARIEGGSPAADTSLGSSFADLAVGIQQPVETSEMARPPVASTVTRAVAPVATAAAHVVPEPSRSVQPAVSPQAAATVTPPVAVQEPMTPAPTHTRSAPVDTTVAALPDTAATPVSVRPKMPAKRPQPPKMTAAPKPAQAKGNANRNARAGSQHGAAAKPAQARQAGKTVSQKAQGNAAAANYAGQVMQRISRVPRPQTSARGVAVVRFSIAANGGLSSVGIAGSSGSAALDQAALAVVRKAQPFPAPPSGAGRSFSIRIKGR